MPEIKNSATDEPAVTEAQANKPEVNKSGSDQEKANKNVILPLAGYALLMFGLGFALEECFGGPIPLRLWRRYPDSYQ